MNSDLTALSALKKAQSNFPSIEKSIRERGTTPIFSYVEEIVKGPFFEPYQSRQDLIKLIYKQAEPVIGSNSAARAAIDIENCPVMITTNHQGIDTFSHSIQSSLLYATGIMKKGVPIKTISILSCSSIPMNNPTYPKGFFLYNLEEDLLDKFPLKIPLFPKRMERQLVYGVPQFTNEMVNSLINRVKNEVHKKHISQKYANKLIFFLKKHLHSKQIINSTNYNFQARALNTRIWNNLFTPEQNFPIINHLDAEKLVSDLLVKDLSDEKSLAFQVLFNSEIRDRIINALNGMTACWDVQKLKIRLQSDFTHLNPMQHNELKSCGTHFFWGITDENRRISFSIECKAPSNWVLLGKDDRGNLYEIDLSRRSLCKALKEKRLIPSVFTCFLVIAFARGITCVGGYFQSTYLPKIQREFTNAFSGLTRFKKCIESIAQSSCDKRFSGMSGVMIKNPLKGLIPCGALEIAMAPINREEVKKLQNLTVSEAHLAAIIETMMDTDDVKQFQPGWKKIIAEDLDDLLTNKLVLREH